MKQVIDGTLYDTEADGVEQLAEDRHGNRGDFEYWEEQLYKTEKGNFFLAGSGGAKSKYGKHLGNGRYSGGSEIKPMTEKEAIQWLEEHDKSDVILERFPEHVETA